VISTHPSHPHPHLPLHLLHLGHLYLHLLPLPLSFRLLQLNLPSTFAHLSFTSLIPHLLLYILHNSQQFASIVARACPCLSHFTRPLMAPSFSLFIFLPLRRLAFCASTPYRLTPTSSRYFISFESPFGTYSPDGSSEPLLLPFTALPPPRFFLFRTVPCSDHSLRLLFSP
jgi:hypothetical protein